MRQLLYLTGYEYRKMLKRKSLWLSFWGCFLIVLFSGSVFFFGSTYVEGEKVYSKQEGLKMEAEASKELEGRVMDAALLREYKKDFAEYSALELGTTLLPENYKEMQGKYLPSILLGVWSMKALGEAENIEDVRERHRAYLRERLEKKELSQEEINWHIQEEKKQDTYIWQTNSGCERFLALQQSTLFFIGIVLVIGTAPLFAQERSCGADALLLTSKLGKEKTGRAKLLAGFSFSLVVSLFFYLSLLLELFLLYGQGDLQAVMQTLPDLAHVSYAFSVGQMLLLIVGCSLLSECLLAAVVMFCSSKMTSAFGPVVIGLLLVMLNLLAAERFQDMGIFTMVWNAIPVIFGSVNSVFSDYLLNINGFLLPAFIYTPLIYLPFFVILWVGARRSFGKYILR